MEHQPVNKKIYLIGSKLNNVDSLIVRDSEASALIHFNSLEEAKACFNSLYKILLAPSFKPSIPPSAEEIQYHQRFMMLMSFYPVVLEFDSSDYRRGCLKRASSFFVLLCTCVDKNRLLLCTYCCYVSVIYVWVNQMLSSKRTISNRLCCCLRIWKSW